MSRYSKPTRYQKRYTGEKHYVYIVRVRRENQTQPSYIFRSYKEFLELHQKLCRRFPLAKFGSLPTGVTIGRSNVQDVAERRKFYLDRFLDGLFKLQEEIAHCDLVYTFFHPLLIDQDEADIYAAKLKNESVKRKRSVGPRGVVQGKLRLSFVYKRDAFQVSCLHI
jgi:phosphatidylinositol-4-phosphate 3-kinase